MSASPAPACADQDPTVFFPVKMTKKTAAPAIAICEECPLRIDCLRVALTRPENDGIWGGKTPLQRAMLRKRAAELIAERSAV